MSALERPVTKQRPVYLNLVRIRLPLPGIVSILHRISGAVLFFVGLPLLLVALQRSLGSPEAFHGLRAALATPLAKSTTVAATNSGASSRIAICGAPCPTYACLRV